MTGTAGGRQRVGEEVQAAARRERREETGLSYVLVLRAPTGSGP